MNNFEINNPAVDKYTDRINRIFADREKWSDGNIDNPVSVFNEYMKWGSFTLYTSENFNATEFQEVNRQNEIQLARSKGLRRFPQFSAKLLELYRSSAEGSSDDVYLPLLEWCARQ